MQRILLIGASGYIGTRLYSHLRETGHHVDGVDLGWYGITYDNILVVDFKHLTKKFLQQYSHVILLAGHSSVAMCANNYESTFNNNVRNFINLVEKLDSHQMLIYASSAAVYGNTANNYVSTESSELLSALNFYDYSKIAVENIVKFYPHKNLVGLRFGSVNGFSFNMRRENLINSLTLTHLENKPMTVSNGQAYRGVLGIRDLCRAIEVIVAHKSVPSRAYNLVSLNDTIMNIALSVQRLSGAEMIVNDSFKTDYSFQCSSNLFKTEFNFTFNDTVESIYTELAENYSNIRFNISRGAMLYD